MCSLGHQQQIEDCVSTHKRGDSSDHRRGKQIKAGSTGRHPCTSVWCACVPCQLRNLRTVTTRAYDHYGRQRNTAGSQNLQFQPPRGSRGGVTAHAQLATAAAPVLAFCLLILLLWARMWPPSNARFAW